MNLLQEVVFLAVQDEFRKKNLEIFGKEEKIFAKISNIFNFSAKYPRISQKIKETTSPLQIFIYLHWRHINIAHAGVISRFGFQIFSGFRTVLIAKLCVSLARKPQNPEKLLDFLSHFILKILQRPPKIYFKGLKMWIFFFK